MPASSPVSRENDPSASSEEEGSLWVEIRIPTDSDLERMNLHSIYEWIRNEAQDPKDVFELAIMGRESEEAEGLRTRYFMKAPDRNRKRDLWGRLEGRGVSVYEVGDPPDFSKYEREAEFEMEDDFSLPLVPIERIRREDYPRTPEKLASAVKDGGAIRIAIRRDDNAGSHIQGFINKEEGRGGDPLAILDGMMDNLVAGRTHDGYREEKWDESYEEDETQYSRLAKERKNLNHVLCEFRAYGTDSQVRGILNSFGFHINDIVELGRGEPECNRKKIERNVREKLKTATDRITSAPRLDGDIRTILEGFEVPRTKTDRDDLRSSLEEMAEELGEASDDLKKASETIDEASDTLGDYHEGEVVPERHKGARSGLLKAAVFLPFVLPFILAYCGWWDPTSILDYSSSLGFIASLWPLLVPLAVTTSLWLWLFGTKGNPIVLSVDELSVIGSLPSRPETLPVQFETPAVPTFGEAEGEEGDEEDKQSRGGVSEDEREEP